MTNPPSSTMAPSEAADSTGATQQARTASSDPPVPSTNKIFVMREYDLVFCAFFPTPPPPAKFHPIPAMTQLFCTILKDEPSLVLRTPTNDKQIILSLASMPTGEAEFKKFLKVTMIRLERQNKTQVCIGCHILSNHSLSNIKHQSPEGNLLAWLKRECIFLESDSLGIERPVTIGYFMKIAPTLTHLSNFRAHLINQLMLVDIKAETVIKLAPHLKQAQIEVMSNGDDFTPILPDFEVYRTRLSHGRMPSQVSTEVLGIKCAPKDAKLLGEFMTHLASITNNNRNGVFLPKGAAYLLGLETYANVLKANEFFLTTVATIPVNLEFDAWFAVINLQHASNDKLISLYDHLTRQPWFLRIESVAPKKCLIVTTHNNLTEARTWIDTNLEPLIRKSIPDGIDLPSSLLPRHLDKPVYSATSTTYDEILKKSFSTTSTPTTQVTANNRPPRKWQAALIEYDSDGSTAPTATTVASTAPSQHIAASPPAQAANATQYVAELADLKNEIASLHNIITSAVAEIKNAITSIYTERTTMPTSIATDDDHPMDMQPSHQPLSELHDIIHELKHDITTIVIETQEMFHQQATQIMLAHPKTASVT